jgi:fibronectin-binding autotransporter adhesin
VLEAAGSYGGATTVQGGSLRAGAANVLTSVSAHEVQASGALDLDGQAQTVASLVNAGTVRLPRTGAPPVPGTTLTVAGNYSGGGVLAMATQLGSEASPSDRLVVNGSVAAGAPTRLDIANAAGLGAATTGSGILVVQVNGGTSPAGAFVLAAPLQAGGYSYQLVQVGSHWYLQSRLTGATGVQQIPALGTAGLAGLALMLGGLAAWRQRRRPGAVRD